MPDYFTNPPPRRQSVLALLERPSGEFAIIDRSYWTTISRWGLPGGSLKPESTSCAVPPRTATPDIFGLAGGTDGGGHPHAVLGRDLTTNGHLLTGELHLHRGTITARQVLRVPRRGHRSVRTRRMRLEWRAWSTEMAYMSGPRPPSTGVRRRLGPIHTVASFQVLFTDPGRVCTGRRTGRLRRSVPRRSPSPQSGRPRGRRFGPPRGRSPGSG